MQHVGTQWHSSDSAEIMFGWWIAVRERDYDNDGRASQSPIWPQTHVHASPEPLPHSEDVVQAQDQKQRHQHLRPESARGRKEQQEGVPQALLAQVYQQDRAAYRGRTR